MDEEEPLPKLRHDSWIVDMNIIIIYDTTSSMHYCVCGWDIDDGWDSCGIW
jgi:hypothetical protein